MTKQAHGNQALTVVQSTLGNFLGPFLTPVLVQMYVSGGAWYTKVLPGVGSYSELYRRVFKQLGLSLLLPLVGSSSLMSLHDTYLTPIFRHLAKSSRTLLLKRPKRFSPTGNLARSRPFLS